MATSQRCQTLSETWQMERKVWSQVRSPSNSSTCPHGDVARGKMPCGHHRKGCICPRNGGAGLRPAPRGHKPATLLLYHNHSMVIVTKKGFKIAEIQQTALYLHPCQYHAQKNHRLFRQTNPSWDWFLSLSHPHACTRVQGVNIYSRGVWAELRHSDGSTCAVWV